MAKETPRGDSMSRTSKIHLDHDTIWNALPTKVDGLTKFAAILNNSAHEVIR